jgi:hypothetical protein
MTTRKKADRSQTKRSVAPYKRTPDAKTKASVRTTRKTSAVKTETSVSDHAEPQQAWERGEGVPTGKNETE